MTDLLAVTQHIRTVPSRSIFPWLLRPASSSLSLPDLKRGVAWMFDLQSGRLIEVVD